MSASIWLFLVTIYGCGIGLALRTLLSRPNGTQVVGMVVAAVGGLFWGWQGGHVGVSPAAAFVSVCLMVTAVVCYARYRESHLRYLLELAPDIREYALTNFDKLDLDHDDTIGLGDLIRAEERVADAEMVHILQRELREIGHVVQAQSVLLPIISRPVEHIVYGISREDLQSFPERMQAAYAREFGPQAQR